MRSFALGSGSSGNCFYIESKEGNGFLVDIGFSFKKIVSILDEKGVFVEDLKGVFITHEHSDHCAGLDVFLKNVKNVKVYLTPGTFDVLGLKDKGRFVFVKEHDVIEIQDMRVFVFGKSHDAVEPVSFVFENFGRKVGVFTDLGFVDSQIKHVLKDLDVVYLEANYCQDVIRASSDLNYNYVNRVSSDVGHLSLGDCCSVLKEIIFSGKKVVLSHISRNTNSYENVYLRLKEHFDYDVITENFVVSFQDEPTKWIE